MKKIFIVLILIGAVWNVYATEELTLIDLTETVFETIIADGDTLELQFKAYGFRYFYSLDDSPDKLNDYNEIITVPIGVQLKLFARNVEFSLSALPTEIENYGFSAYMRQGSRSGRGNLEEKTGFLLFQDKLGNDNSSLQKSNGIILTNASEETVRALISSKIRPAND